MVAEAGQYSFYIHIRPQIQLRRVIFLQSTARLDPFCKLAYTQTATLQCEVARAVPLSGGGVGTHQCSVGGSA